MITIGAPASALPDIDAIDDAYWADSQPGIAAVWFVDHLTGWAPRGTTDKTHVADPHAVHDPFALMAVAARATERIEIGVAVTDPVRRSTAALAQSALTISSLGGGRPVHLGLGAGAEHNLSPFGGRPARTAEFGHAASMIRDMTDPAGAHPIGIAGHGRVTLPIAAHGPRGLDIVARHGDAWLPSGISPKRYAEGLRTIRACAASYGRSPEAITPMLFLWTALADTPEGARTLLNSPVVRAASFYAGRMAFEHKGAIFPFSGQAYMPQELDDVDSARDVIAGIPQSIAERRVIAGTPVEVALRIQAYESAGCEHVILYDIGRHANNGVRQVRERLLEVAEIVSGRR